MALKNIPDLQQFNNIVSRLIYGKREAQYYKVLIGPFDSRPSAAALLSSIRQAGYPEAWIVEESGYASYYWKIADDQPTTYYSPSTPHYRATPITHVVQEGETLFGIAAHYSLDLGKLIQLNQLEDKNMVVPGQLLLLK